MQSRMLTATMTRIYHFGLKPCNRPRSASGWRQDLSIKPRSANPLTRLERTVFVKRPVVNAMTTVEIRLALLQLMMMFVIVCGSPSGLDIKGIFVSQGSPAFFDLSRNL
jgi:hypothetical protein